MVTSSTIRSFRPLAAWAASSATFRVLERSLYGVSVVAGDELDAVDCIIIEPAESQRHLAGPASSQTSPAQ